MPKQKVMRVAANGWKLEVWSGPTKYEPSPCKRCIAEGRCYVDGRVVTKESNKSLDGCGNAAKRTFVVRSGTEPLTEMHATEAALDHLFPDEDEFMSQKARVLEYARLQPEPAIHHAIARRGSPDALRALVAEGALVRVGRSRYYVPLKVTVNGKTFYAEPPSVKRWKAQAGKRVTDIDNLWRRKTEK